MFLIELNPGISNIASLSPLNKNDVLPSRWEKIIISDLDWVPHPWEIELAHLAASISEKRGSFFSLCRPCPCVYPLASSAYFVFLGVLKIMRISERLTTRLRFSTEKPCQSLNRSERWVSTFLNCHRSWFQGGKKYIQRGFCFWRFFEEKWKQIFSQKMLFWPSFYVVKPLTRLFTNLTDQIPLCFY